MGTINFGRINYRCGATLRREEYKEAFKKLGEEYEKMFFGEEFVIETNYSEER